MSVHKKEAPEVELTPEAPEVAKEPEAPKAPEVFVVVNKSGRPITFGEVLLIPGEEVSIDADLFELIKGNENIHSVKAKAE